MRKVPAQPRAGHSTPCCEPDLILRMTNSLTDSSAIDADAPEEGPDLALGFRIVTWIGIIEQLTRTMANRDLSEIGLPWNQFVLLNHFSHRPAEGKTVTGVARAMQQQQPGITKTMKSMVEGGLLRIEADPKDGRIKFHYMTDHGQQRHKEAVNRLLPRLHDLFRDWSREEMDQTFASLDRMKVWLDDNR